MRKSTGVGLGLGVKVHQVVFELAVLRSLNLRYEMLDLQSRLHCNRTPMCTKALIYLIQMGSLQACKDDDVVN